MAEVAPSKVAEVLKAAEALRPQTTGHVARVVQIDNPPPSLLRLALGHVVNAEVLESAKPGQFFLKSAAGILQATSLSDRLVLPNGSQVALKIFTKTPALRAHLEILNQPSKATPASPHHTVSDTVSQSSGIAARLLPPAGSQTANTTPLPVTLRGLVPANQPGPQATAVPPAPAGTAAPSLAALKAGDALQLTGQVQRSAPGQPTVLSTPLGRIETAAPLPLRPGESVRFTIAVPAQSQEPLGQTSLAPARSAATFLVGQPWSNLEELAQMLSPESRSALALQPSSTAGANNKDLPLLRLLVSIVSGEPQLWQSAALVAGLQRAGRGEFASRLEDDQRLAAQIVADDRGDWRLSLAPFIQDERIHALRFYRRDADSHGEGHEEHGQATRFVVELDLTRYGLFQMDGLVSGKRFDLAVRSRRGLAPHLREDLRAIYEDAISGAGLVGQIIFDDGPDWRAMPLPGGRSAPVRATA